MASDDDDDLGTAKVKEKAYVTERVNHKEETIVIRKSS